MADEKTQAAIDKAVTKAVKEERKRCLDVVRTATTDAGAIENRDVKREVKTSLKAISDGIKAA